MHTPPMRWYSMVVIYLFNLAWFHVLFSILKINMHLIWKCICYTIFASQGLRSAPLLSRSGEERIVTLGKRRCCYAYHMKNCRRAGISLSLSLSLSLSQSTIILFIKSRYVDRNGAILIIFPLEFSNILCPLSLVVPRFSLMHENPFKCYSIDVWFYKLLIFDLRID